jgi:hypothetical protein
VQDSARTSIADANAVAGHLPQITDRIIAAHPAFTAAMTQGFLVAAAVPDVSQAPTSTSSSV